MPDVHTLRRTLLAGALAFVLLPTLTPPRHAHACACGCGVFEVGVPSQLPARSGGEFSLEYDLMDQDRNWSGTAAAPADANEDRQVRTGFVTASVRQALGHGWAATLDVPWWHRRFVTRADDGSFSAFTHGALGDVRILGTYAGFSPDLSTGVSLGVKLPTGDRTYPGFDRDTQIGAGSTDLLLGAYHVGPLTARRAWNWFVDARWSRPVATTGAYRPGAEGNLTLAMASAGVHLGAATLAPLLGVLGSVRARDAGDDAAPDDSGYERVLLSPGLDARFAGVHVAVTVLVPVHERVNGHQLVPPSLLKVVIGHAF